MKPEIHPKSRLVVFEDAQTKKQFLIESTVNTKDKTVYELDGKEYPVVRLEVTSDTHPFYTGEQSFIVSAGRVDKFKKRMEKTKEEQETLRLERAKHLEEKARKDKKEKAQDETKTQNQAA